MFLTTRDNEIRPKDVPFTDIVDIDLDRYTEIDPNPRKRNSKRNTDYYVEPVTHSKLRRSGKIKYIKSEGKIIKVWPNGDSVNPPRVILLTSWMQKDMDVIYDAIAERVSALLAGSVTRLYSLDGTRIKYTDQIHHGGQYVACAHQDKLRHVDYKDHGAKSIMTTPRLDSKYLPPLSRSTNKSTKSSKFSTPDHSNPTSSYASDKSSKSGYTTKYKSRQQTKKEDDGVFHAKPVAHKRGSQEKVKKVDYDKDSATSHQQDKGRKKRNEGGVFKAKGKNRSTSGAREVEETADTRTELPIDQREAETIEEDDDRNRSKNNNNSRTPRNNPPPQRPQKANSKSRTSNHSNQEQTTPRDNGKNSEEEAAIKIQSQFRGYQTRRQLTEEGVLNRPNGYVSRSPTPPTQPKTKPTRTNNNIKTQPKPVTKATRHTPKSTQPTQEKKTADKTPPKNGPKKTSKTPDNKKETKSKKGNNDQEVKAATTIQAGFRGYKTRKDLKKRQDTPIGSMSEELAATKIQAGFRGKKARSDMKKAKSELEDKVQKKYSEEEEKAATKIQAGFRGYKTRRDQLLKESEDFYTEQEHQAAAKIQSGYRGFRARKELALQRQS